MANSINSPNIERFTDRADNYEKFRPGYPQSLIDYLSEQLHAQQPNVVAELGAGTGILSLELAKLNLELYVFEPNKEMRDKAIVSLQDRGNCVISDKKAEDTGLPSASCDMIVCAQAFHWFDTSKAKKEFQRIIKPDGSVAIIWNIRSIENAFGNAYEDFINNFSIDYEEVRKRQYRGNNLPLFFREGTMQQLVFHYKTRISLEQLKGRTLSYSYMPNTGHPALKETMKALEVLFRKHEQEGIVELNYKTVLYIGKM